ncbi:MAG: hypothetical protein ACR652_26870 [Methylocystis sp.]|uniref:hypothetical protein n=1 Tax=Methylocystis sp. TaxID=1911079 RepID=UPI003DA2F608
MFRIAAFVATVMLCGSAFAQTNTGPSSNMPSQGNTGATQQPLPMRIQKKLKDQGFTDIKVVPEGFIVTAKDRDGDPVTMVIGPNSVAMFTVGSAGDKSSANQSASDGTADANR